MKAYRGRPREEPMPTKEKLARALEADGAPPAMITKARAGAYDDYQSESATPIVDLVNECRVHGLYAMAERAMAGDFDGTREEAEAWARSADGQRVFRRFLRGQ